MKRTVISLGGSLIVPDDLQVDFLRQFHDLIVSLLENHAFIIYAGGGSIARKYMDGARAVAQLTNDQLDWLGIHASRLNGQLLRTLFGQRAAEELLIDPTVRVEEQHPVVVGAGWKPGWSTDYDAVQAAATNGYSQVVNLSNIPHVYDKDPKTHKDAQPFDEMAWGQFRELVGDEWKPGMNAPFDPIAAKLAEEQGIEVIIADGLNIGNIKAILTGEPFTGTRIHG